MTDEVKAFATSPRVASQDPMDFPYRGTKGLLGFGCDGEDEWVYMKFTKQPNITNDEAQRGGYSTFSTRMKWDTAVKNVRLSQEWGSKVIQYQQDEEAIDQIVKSNKALVELDWHGTGNTYFEFPLKGSARSIKQARQVCREK